MNYTELYNAIIAYSENSNTSFTNNIPNFVRLAEKRIYNAVQLPLFRYNAQSSTVADSKYLQAPSDMLSVFSMAVVDSSNNYQYLINKDVSFIREAYPSATYSATPKYYALFDDNTFLLGPTPDAVYTVELHYYYYPESIVDASTSWLGDKYDQVLLYGSLIEANIFMKGEADMNEAYVKQYEFGMSQLKQLGDAKDRMDVYRSGQLRLPVT